MAVRALWGDVARSQRERFQIADGELTDAYIAANTKLAKLDESKKVFLYVEYTKGAETDLELRLSLANGDINDNAKLFQDQEVAADGTVTPRTYTLTGSGLYRIPLDVAPSERLLEVAARGVGAGSPYAGAVVELFFGTDNFRKEG